jgi:hypothetical protein
MLRVSDDERQHGHDAGGNCRNGEDGGQADAGVLQRPGSEGGDPVAELIRRDHHPGRGRRDGDEVRLGEADRERQQSRASETGDREGDNTGDGIAIGQ